MDAVRYALIGILFSSLTAQAGQGASTETNNETEQTRKETQDVIVHVSPSDHEITIVIHNTNTNTNTNQNAAKNKATNTNQPHNVNSLESGITNNPIFQGVFSFTSSIKNSATSWLSNKLAQHNMQITDIHPSQLAANGSAFIFAHKGKFIVGTALATYLGIVAALYAGNRYLNNPKRWCCWKRQMSIEEMQLCTQKQLEADLVTHIQRQYLNPQNPTDKLTPLIQFMKVIDREMVIVGRYLTLATTINRCRLSRIFPITDQKIERAQEKKQRLTFIKHIFVSWAAQHNFETI